MPVNVSSLRAQITSYADRLAESSRSRQEVINQLCRVFEPGFDADALLATCLAASRVEGMRWSGALFNLNESINQQFPFGKESERYALIATDGSQIMPDRHKPFLFAYIQAGCACITYGAPDQSLSRELQSTKPSRMIFEEDLYDSTTGELKPYAEVTNQRDALEIELLAQACMKAHNTGFRPVLIADGSIVPFPLLGGRNVKRDAEKLLPPITRALNVMRECNALVCGYIDKPNSNGVARTCALVDTPYDQVSETRLRQLDQFISGIFDRHLIERELKPGHRTALFDPNWEVNGLLGSHAMRACYVNFGPGQGKFAIIGRIEMPSWCANAESVNALAPILYRQARLGEGYPLILKAAHEEAVVSKEDQREIEQAIEKALLDQGMIARTSYKQDAKDRG